MRLILLLDGAFMLETFDGVGYIVRHREMHLPCFVVLIEGKAEVTLSFPVCCAFIMLSNDTH